MGSLPRSLCLSGLMHLGLLFGLGLGWGLYPDTPSTLNVVFVDPSDEASKTDPDATQPAIGAAYASVELLPQSFEAPSQTTASDPADGADVDAAAALLEVLPRERVVLANQQDTAFTRYLEQWSHRIERIGSRYAPKTDDGRPLYGSLVLDVVVDGSGSVRSIKLLRPSGKPLLDQGAERIVKLAAPFDPFTKAMLIELDRLHIIRTWNFEPAPVRADPDDDQ